MTNQTAIETKQEAIAKNLTLSSRLKDLMLAALPAGPLTQAELRAKFRHTWHELERDLNDLAKFQELEDRKIARTAEMFGCTGRCDNCDGFACCPC